MSYESASEKDGVQPPFKRSRVTVESNGLIIQESCNKNKTKIVVTDTPRTPCEVPTDEDAYESDLPLLSNVEDVRITHYIFLLEIFPDSKIVCGTAIILTEKVQEWPNVSEIILDCCAMDVQHVQVIRRQPVKDPASAMELLKAEVVQELSFKQDKWSLKISGWTSDFPEAVRIHYRTLPTTPSLHWRPVCGFKFQPDVPLCCYTPAAPVNNRGLFPCQEPPSAMATWQCFVKVKKPHVAFLSSDHPGIVISDDREESTSYFNCSESLPMSTFAIFVTTLNPENILEDVRQDEDLSIPVRVIFQEDNGSTHASELLRFIVKLLGRTNCTLGKLPFSRLDAIIMPKTFPTLGLANPNMIFLSPSLLTGQTPLLFCRMAHEIAHFWFGLSIGALDWTEEWLSEGFATFMEDILLQDSLLAQVESGCSVAEDLIAGIPLRSCVRLITLQHELENTQENHPDLTLLVHDKNELTKTAVKNGLEPMKQVMQVHYLKGYFYLRTLSHIVGELRFLCFLRDYVQVFKGTLVTSEQFVNFFKTKFCPDPLSIADIDSITSDWLQKSGLPPPYSSVNLNKTTMVLPASTQVLFPNAVESLSKINSLTLNFPQDPQLERPLNSIEKLIFIEQMLTLDKLDGSEVDRLEAIVNPSKENPEVIHRWCELIIKFRCTSRLDIIQDFLLNHPAMGVYLYGELMISERRKYQKLARKVYKSRKNILDPPLLQILKAMIF